jgi:two-component system nitrogen regulation sensor histidine kinase NtrY
MSFMSSTAPIEPITLRKVSRRTRRRVVGLALMSLALITLTLLLTLVDEVGEGTTSPQSVVWLTISTLTLLLALAVIIVRRAYDLWQASKKGMVGTRLQTRILMMFCVVTIVPTIIVSIFSAVFFNIGVKSWFDQRVSVALQESVVIARAYMDEHRSSIQSDAMGLAGDIKRELALGITQPKEFERKLTVQTALRSLSEAIVFERNRVLARTALSFSLVFERLPEEVFDRADRDETVILGEGNDRIQAVIKISQYPDIYLLVSRVVDPKVIQHMQSAKGTVKQFKKLEHDIAALRLQFSIAFIMLALLLLLASIWAGMQLAMRLITPISQLISATDRVRSGDYSIKVKEGPANDEVANLARTFNRMTAQLEKQRSDLMEANRLVDERRRFTEAVLSGVSAGVIALDAHGLITLHNRRATELLGLAEHATLTHRALEEILPEMRPLIAQAEKKPEKGAAQDIVIERGETRATLHVQITVERFMDVIEGFIVTFDDITDLMSAQRSAAWADVARRIAHEIKNPLTPITLSTERLKKKFGPEITSDKESYLRYIDTISRHVKDIGRMVEEFVAFARMPTPTFKEEDISALIKKTVFSEQTVHPEITYETDIPDGLKLVCDERQVGQVLLNVIKNAAEAFEPLPKEHARIIHIALQASEDFVTVTIADTGTGFPVDKIDRLTEPYVTTRVKGTGLGLAIVKRSMEDHRGSITLSNRDDGGAQVQLAFSRKITHT